MQSISPGLDAPSAGRFNADPDDSKGPERIVAQNAEPPQASSTGLLPTILPTTTSTPFADSTDFKLEDRFLAKPMEELYYLSCSKAFEGILELGLNPGMPAGADIPPSILAALMEFKDEILGRGKTGEQQRLALAHLSLRELVTCLVGAFLLRGVFQAQLEDEFEKVQERINDGLDIYRQGLTETIATFRSDKDTVLRRTYSSTIQGLPFRDEKLSVQADALTLQLAHILCGDEDTVSSTREKWTALLREPVMDALSLKYIISSVREQYDFSWPATGGDSDGKWMIGTHGNGETVVATIFAGMAVWKRGRLVPVRSAMVKLI